MYFVVLSAVVIKKRVSTTNVYSVRKSMLKVVSCSFNTFNSERYQSDILNFIKVQCDSIAYPMHN